MRTQTVPALSAKYDPGEQIHPIAPAGKGGTKHPILTNGGEQELFFISESDLYRLIVKSQLPAAEQFERWVFEEVLPAIRKTGSYAALLSPTDMLELQVKALRQMEQAQADQQRALAETNARIDGIKDAIQLNPQSWREECRKLIVRIADVRGGRDRIRDVNTEVFSLVDVRAGVSLKRRQTLKRQRMAYAGVCKSARERVTYVDIIAEDKKLIEIYVAIVKEMAVKYLDAVPA